MKPIIKYDEKKTILQNLVDFLDRNKVRIGYITALFFTLLFIFKDLIGQVVSPEIIGKILLPIGIVLVWDIATKITQILQNQTDASKNFPVLISETNEALTLTDSADKIGKILSNHPGAEVSVDFLGHNLSMFKDVVTKILSDGNGFSKKLMVQIVMLDPNINKKSKSHFKDFFSSAKEGHKSIDFIQTKIKSNKSNLDTLDANIEINCYQESIQCGGFRVSIPSANEFHYFVADVGPQSDTKDFFFTNEYYHVVVHCKDENYIINSKLSSLVSAKRYIGQLGFSLEKDKGAKKLYALYNYPKNDTFEPPQGSQSIPANFILGLNGI